MELLDRLLFHQYLQQTSNVSRKVIQNVLRDISIQNPPQQVSIEDQIFNMTFNICQKQKPTEHFAKPDF